MAITYEFIAKANITSNTTTVSFTSLSTSYTHFYLYASARTTKTAGVVWDNIYTNFNNQTTNDITNIMYGEWNSGFGGTTYTSGDLAGIMSISSVPGANASSSVFGNAFVLIPNFNGAKAKSTVGHNTMENGSGAASAGISMFNSAGYTTTTAITSIDITAVGSPYVQYTNYYLYGLKTTV